MSLTTEEQHWHTHYRSSDDDTIAHIDLAFQVLRDALRTQGFSPANDDRAEAMIAAITKYILTSRKG